jgi:hypothetical protein
MTALLVVTDRTSVFASGNAIRRQPIAANSYSFAFDQRYSTTIGDSS